MLDEPVVTLTDWLLATECAVLAWVLGRRSGRADRRRAFVAFFAAAGIAPFLGGLVHGVFSDATSTVHRVLWKATLLAVGVAALAAWEAGLTILEPVAAGPMRRVLATVYAVYAGVVLWGVTDFLVAVVAYLPAILFLLVVFGREHARTGSARARDGVLALVLSLVAAGIQQARFAVHPVWLDHNALYHLVQAVAFLLLFRCASSLVEGRTSVEGRAPEAPAR